MADFCAAANGALALGLVSGLVASQCATPVLEAILTYVMAEGALEASNAHVSVAITGVAGPGGGTPMKPVGTVHIATARANQALMHRAELFDGATRGEIQEQAIQAALQALRDRMT